MHLNFKITALTNSKISSGQNRRCVSRLFNDRYSYLFNLQQDISSCYTNGNCISYCFSILFVVNPIFL